jgi:hypothetical protein
MNFINLLQKLEEAASTPKSGESLKKERSASISTDYRSKDAARKRIERSRQVPRERKSKQELIQEVIAVKTKSGRIQLIFKDSYNKDLHQKLTKESLTIEEAQQFLKDPKFEQTRASKLLFGNVKEKETSKKESKEKKPESKEKGQNKPQEKGESKEKGEGEEKPQPKAKRLSKEEIFKVMGQMNGQQLASVPLDLRQEYFKMIRKPPTNVDFDNTTFEGLSVKYGISPISSLTYNQQVLNAVLFLAKLKSGASEQEMQAYGAVAPLATEFTKNAFDTAQKILSQIGEECIQNLLSSIETGTQAINSEGAVDMECGKYKFKVAAGGEIALSTNQFDQSNKSFRGLVGSALMMSLSNPSLMQEDPKVAELFDTGKEESTKFSKVLIPDQFLGAILADDSLKNELSKMQFTNGNGENIGPIMDENGQLNPFASLVNYQNVWNNVGKKLLSGSKSSKKSPFKALIASNILKSVLRGDNLVKPENAPNHLVTVNGVFALSDDYFNAIATQAEMDVKPAKDIMSSSNISRYDAGAAETMKKYRVMVEEKKSGNSLKDILISKDDISPIESMVQVIMNNNDFTLNASLLPGFDVKDLNSIEYNYVTFGKKTIKIPVLNNEKIANQITEDHAIFINDVLIEALTNNFVLKSLKKSELLSDSQEALFELDSSLLLESIQGNSPLKSIYNDIWNAVLNDSAKMTNLISFLEEAERDYKKEYRNYHGKPKQRKERAARTAARELMIKKGRAKKGDGKDIDHKRPLRKGGSKSLNNLRVRDRSSNRSDNGHKKGEDQKKGSWK